MNIRKSFVRLPLVCAVFGCIIAALCIVTPQTALAAQSADGFTFEITQSATDAEPAFARITGVPVSAGSNVIIPEFVQSGAKLYAVTEIVLKSGSFSSLDVSACKALKYLDCSAGKLRTLTLGSNEALEYLYCHNNSLSSLSLSGLARLIWLDCSANALTSLDTRNNPRLSWLKAESNSLKAIDLRNNAVLEKAELQCNKLTEIYIASLQKLRKLDVRSNCLSPGGVKGLDGTMSEQLATHFAFYCTAAAGQLDSTCETVHGYYAEPQYPGIASFSDVNWGDWFLKYVDFAFQNGLMAGIGDNKFNPGGTLTRGMVVTILYNLEGKPKISGSSPFADVPNGAWYTDPVVWAANNRIVSGYGDGIFGPDDPVTREQFAVILFKYAKMKEKDTSKRKDLSAFTDSDKISWWAREAASWCAANGVINGDPAKNFNPQNSATRAEAASMFYNFLINVMGIQGTS
jgi:hypothetical protein